MRTKILILLLTGISYISLLGQEKLASETGIVSIKVAGVCGMCRDRIESNALQVTGVVQASWNEEDQMLTVQVNDPQFDLMKLHQQMASSGHATSILDAVDKAYRSLPFCCQYGNPENPHTLEKEMANRQDAKTIAIRVSGICDMCRDRIEQVALDSKGVTEASWDPESQYLRFTYVPGEFDEMGLHSRLAKAGHATDLYEADEEAYANLPKCCRYADPGNPHSLESGPNETFLEMVSGKVYERNEAGELLPLIGANLFWLESDQGVSTDLEGYFEIHSGEEDRHLVISYVGYNTDTLEVDKNKGMELDVILSHGKQLDVIEIVHRKRSTEISLVDPIKIHKIGEDELLKAACCNLSESFTTSPSIDVSFTDAVTGTRKIEMLGLAGKYVQIMSESMPDIRALSSINGLGFVPGPWIEGIQLNMGTGSVVNGFESMTGQINVEMKKPWESEKLYLNLYASQEGRLEANTNVSQVIDDQWSTGLMLHASKNGTASDHNGDGFLDMPLGDNIIALNRWKYMGKNGLMSQFNIKTTQVQKNSGQLAYYDQSQKDDQWAALQKTNRTEAWFKMGKIFPARPYASVGFQLYGVNHDQDFSFGGRDYNALQQSLFANLIYQSIFGNSSHQYRTGISFLMDRIEEEISGKSFERDEKVPGAFFEYTFLPDDRLSVVSGIRADYHNQYGFFMTPRLNVKYALAERSILRAAAGKGQHTASIFSENLGFLASSRELEILVDDNDNPYGLDPEIAWNFGLNFTQIFDFLGRESILSVDAYRTHFENQIVVDIEDIRKISFYNLQGKSFSNSLQLQWDLTPLESLDVRMAYRYNDVQTTFSGVLMQKPLSSKHRAFINFAYATRNQWYFDLTLNWQGQKRLPDSSMNPEPYRLEDYSPDFYMVNAQVSKRWGKWLEIYLGGENLTGFRQENAIIAAEDPFGPYFDSSLIWGPVFGRNLYAGIRWRIY